MLGKLFKHEWKSVYKVECLLLVIMFSFTLVGAIVFHTPAMDVLFGDNVDIPDSLAMFWVMSVVSSVFMYIIILMGTVYGNIIYLGVHFHKTMYTDEGYLSHTLPVSSHQLLGSKILVGAVWTFIMQCAVAASVLILIFSLAFAMEPDLFRNVSVSEFYEAFNDIYWDDFSVGHYLGTWILTILINPVCSVIILFGALTIGQLSKKHKAIMGIVAYFAINFGKNLLTNLSQAIGNLLTMASGYRSSSYNTTLFFSADMKLILGILVAVGLYFLSHYIINQKLNLN